MQLGKTLAIGSFIAVACAAGCHREQKPNAPTSAAPVIGTARIPAGTLFTVRMIDPISSDTAVPGRVFTARLRDPLIGPDGRAVAPASAIVTGHIVAVQHGERPRLALSFDTLETFEGVSAIDTKGDTVTNTGLSLGELRTASETTADLVLRPDYDKLPAGVGGGPPAAPPTISLRYDTELDLRLTKPLIIDRTKR